MSEICNDDDSCSSSSCPTSLLMKQQQQSKTTTASSLTTTPVLPLPNFSSPSSSSTTSPQQQNSSTARKVPALQSKRKLNLPPRNLQTMTAVSVVRLSGSLNSSSFQSSTTNSPPAAADQQQQQHQQMKTVSPASSSTSSTNSSFLLSPQISPSSLNVNNNNNINGASSPSSASSSCVFSIASGGNSPSSLSSNQTSPQPTSFATFPQQQHQYINNNNNNTTTTMNMKSASSSSVTFNATRVHPQIYLGSQMDCLSAAELIAHGIFFILNVASECDFSDDVNNDSRITKKKLCLRDSIEENIARAFDEACEFIDSALQTNLCIIVHCFCGVSRSPTIVIAYLMRCQSDKDVAESMKEQARSEVIEQHRIEDQRSTCNSPTMFDEMKQQEEQEQIEQQQIQQQIQLQQEQDQDQEEDIFASAASQTAEFSSMLFSTSNGKCLSTATSKLQQQHQEEQEKTFSSISSSTSSCSSQNRHLYYKKNLRDIQKLRDEVLPNFAFTTALLAYDDKLCCRVSA